MRTCLAEVKNQEQNTTVKKLNLGGARPASGVTALPASACGAAGFGGGRGVRLGASVMREGRGRGTEGVGERVERERRRREGVGERGRGSVRSRR